MTPQRLILLLVGIAALICLAAAGAYRIVTQSAEDQRPPAELSSTEAPSQPAPDPVSTRSVNLPRIAIITNDQLEYFYSDTEKRRLARERQDLQQKDRKAAEARDSDETAETIQEAVGALSRAIDDQLETILADNLTATKRFVVVEPLKVSQIISKLAKDMQSPSMRDIEEGFEELEYGDGSQVDGLSSILRRSLNLDFSLFRQTETVETESGDYSTYEVQSSGLGTFSSNDVQTADLQKAAKELGAEYILVVATEQPRTSIVRYKPAYSDETRFFVNVEPVFSYRLFQAGASTVLMSKVRRPERAIRVPIDTEYQQSVTFAQAIAQDQANLRLFNQISSLLVRDLIDAVAPAQISTTDPYTFDRGSADGVRENQIFDISRLAANQAVDANGAVLNERVRVPIGSVRVVKTQPNIAYLETVTGGPFEVGNVVEIGDRLTARVTSDGASFGSQPMRMAGGAQSSSAPALGARALAEERAGRSDAPTIAINEVTSLYNNCAQCADFASNGDMLEAALIEAFRGDRRVNVLSRSDFAAMMSERGLRDEATGNVRFGTEGMKPSDYILTGAVRLTVAAKDDTISVGGQTRVTGGSSTISAEGTFRILNPETSEVIESATVNTSKSYSTKAGGRTQGAYDAVIRDLSGEAVSLLTKRLFPPVILGASEDGKLVRIGAGTLSGFSPGKRVAVYKTGEAQIDYYTNRVLSRSRELAGHLIVVDARRDVSTARYEGRVFDVRMGDEVEITFAGTQPSSSAASEPASEAASPAPRRDENAEPDVPF